MKKLAVVFMILLSILLFSCNDQPHRTVGSNGQSRFIFTGQEFYIDGNTALLLVFEDTETKVLYLFSNGNGAGMTPWLDENGKPMKSINN